MNSEQLINYCLTKKYSYIDFPFGEQPVCIKVNGKIFAEIYTFPIPKIYRCSNLLMVCCRNNCLN